MYYYVGTRSGGEQGSRKIGGGGEGTFYDPLPRRRLGEGVSREIAFSTQKKTELLTVFFKLQENRVPTTMNHLTKVARHVSQTNRRFLCPNNIASRYTTYEYLTYYTRYTPNFPLLRDAVSRPIMKWCTND